METHRHRVLVVDGEDGDREGLTHLLALRGIDIVAVKNGQAALEALADGARCCMIILDRSMARTAGYGLLAPEGADPALRRLPVVVIPYGADSYAAGESICYALPKPVDPDTIRLLLARECAANPGSPAVRHSDLTWPVDLTT